MKDDQLVAREPVAASEMVLERIGHSILSGEFEPGERLTETGLAQRFGVSRSPLREALLRLEERQLIERVPFSGMRVVSLDDRTVDELYEIRGALEGLACRRAAAVITPGQIAELRGVLDQRSKALKSTRDGDARRQPTIQDFHILIARISGNRELERMLAGDIWHYMRAQYRRWARTRERMDIGHAEHLRIVDALEARDGELAEILMRRHIVASRQELVDAKARAEARGAA